MKPLLRAIADYYASQTGLTVPAARFSEGQRSQKDVLPAITYERSGYEEDYHQRGSGLVRETVAMTVWAETPAQAGRIAAELRDKFHLMRYQTIGSGDHQMMVDFCTLESGLNATEYPNNEGANFVCSSVLYFDFQYRGAVPSTLPS